MEKKARESETASHGPDDKPRSREGYWRLRRHIWDQLAVYGLVTARSVSRHFGKGVPHAGRFLNQLSRDGHLHRYKLPFETRSEPLVAYSNRRYEHTTPLHDAYCLLHFCQIQAPKRDLLKRNQFSRLTRSLVDDNAAHPIRYVPCYLDRVSKRELRLALVRVIRTADQERVISKAEDFVGHPAFAAWRVALSSGKLALTLLVPGKSEVIGELRRRFRRRPLLSRANRGEPIEVPVNLYSAYRPDPPKTKAP